MHTGLVLSLVLQRWGLCAALTNQRHEPPLVDKLLVGAEYRHEITLTHGPIPDRRWFFLGPSASYARGRLGGAFSFLLGAGTAP